MSTSLMVNHWCSSGKLPSIAKLKSPMPMIRSPISSAKLFRLRVDCLRSSSKLKILIRWWSYPSRESAARTQSTAVVSSVFKTWVTLASWTQYFSALLILNLSSSFSSLKSTWTMLIRGIRLGLADALQWHSQSYYLICGQDAKSMWHLGTSRTGLHVRLFNFRDLLSMTLKRCSLCCLKRCMRISTPWLKSPMSRWKTAMEGQMRSLRRSSGRDSTSVTTPSLLNFSMGS